MTPKSTTTGGVHHAAQEGQLAQGRQSEHPHGGQSGQTKKTGDCHRAVDGGQEQAPLSCDRCGYDGKTDWYDFLKEHDWCLVGTPDEVTDVLKRFESELGLEHLIL